MGKFISAVLAVSTLTLIANAQIQKTFKLYSAIHPQVFVETKRLRARTVFDT